MSNKVLFKEKLFYIPVLALLSLSVLSALIIVMNSPLVWDLSFEGFNYAVNAFKVPLGIIAICGTWAALSSANHRSKLMIEQINETSSQNVFTNYFKHLEEFQKYLKSNKILGDQLIDARDVHDALYGSFDKFSPRVNPQVRAGLHKQIVEIYLVLLKIDKGGEIEIRTEISQWNSATSWIERLINISPEMEPVNLVVIEIDGIYVPYPKDLVTVVKETGRILGILEFVLKFSLDNHKTAAFNGLRQAFSIRKAKGEMGGIGNPEFVFSTPKQFLNPVGLGLKDITEDGLNYIGESPQYTA